jgi:hypothetical protein
MAPVIDAVAIDYSGRVKIGKVNVDDTRILPGNSKSKGFQP